MKSGGQPPTVLEQMRAVLRVKQYAWRTERAYPDWVRRLAKFHRKTRATLALWRPVQFHDLVGGHNHGATVQ